MWVAAVLFPLGLDVSKSPGDTQSTWEDTVWSVDYVGVRLSLACLLAHQGVVLAWLVGDGLDLLVVALCDGQSLVDLSTCLEDPFLFHVIIWLVIVRQRHTKVASISTEDGPAVTNVDDVDSFFNQESNHSTRPTSIEHVRATGSEVLDGVEEILLCLLVAIDDGLPWIGRKVTVFDDELVQVVPQEVCACVATVAVENAEEGALGPVFDVLFAWRLHDVEDDADSVLVVVSDDALVGVRCVADDWAVLTNTALGGFPLRKIDGRWVHRWIVRQQESLDVEFLLPAVALSAVGVILNDVGLHMLVQRRRLGRRTVGVLSAVSDHGGEGRRSRGACVSVGIASLHGLLLHLSIDACALTSGPV